MSVHAVGGAPAIVLSYAGIGFSVTQGGANPPLRDIVSVTNGGGGTLSGLAVGTISYADGQPTGWLTASLSSSTAPDTLTLIATAGSLTAGMYTATVPVTSSVASNSPQTLPVWFTITPLAPAIALNSSNISFSATQGGANPASRTVSTTNSGGGTLSGLAVGTISYGTGQPTGWLSAELSGGTAPATLTLTATAGSLTAGPYTATVPVTSSVASNSPQNVSIAFTLTAVPATKLVFRVQPSNTATGAVITPAVQVTAQDPAGNTATGFAGTVTVAIGANANGGTLSGTTSVPAVNGIATFSNLSVDRPGSGYTLVATSGMLTTGTSGAFSIQGFATIGAGAQHTCGVTMGGVAYCWGSNFFGQLGDRTITDRLSPVFGAGGRGV